MNTLLHKNLRKNYYREKKKKRGIDKVNTKDEVSILFSGGSDSTLVAALMCEQFEKVHLLTYFHLGMPLAERSEINAERLVNRFGKDKITHKLINFEELFKKLYYGTYLRDIIKYKGYMTPCSCNACQIAMHTNTILYNIENNIHFACDGYKREKRHLYIFMAEEGIKETRKFYKEYQIDYKNPVYDIVRTDWKLFEMGITSKKNVKFPHELVDYSTQHHCRTGTIVNAYLMGYFFPLYGQEASASISIKYWREKIEISKRYIREHFNNKHLNLVW